MMNTQQKIINFTLAQEGLYQCDRSDSGNWSGGEIGSGNLVGTKYGISAPLLQSVRGNRYRLTQGDMQMLTEAEARAIAVAQYWRTMHCDKLPVGVDAMVFDYGFNAGSRASVMLLQQACGAPQDGVIGQKTLAAISEVSGEKLAVFLSSSNISALQKWVALPQTGMLDAKTLETIKNCDLHLYIFCAALAKLQIRKYRKMPGFLRFGKGWTNRTKARFDFACRLLHGTNFPPAGV